MIPIATKAPVATTSGIVMFMSFDASDAFRRRAKGM
ncbi:hypothetical protein YSA_03590 [Pseudomonas putida ND6]|uniref:Uncharacterized protein n=1 Tax=Pseudomonas putida ND6 TaxID=231023 RepID=I3UT83_PSEPU|nr:hypothetical protein YSA_03590 [Pseudomonas putida ND6]